MVFEVEAPKGTKAKSIRIVGDHKKLGAWQPSNGLVLERAKDGVYRGKITLPKGSLISFKIVRDDSWVSVEKTRSGGEVTNRSATIEAGPVRIKVARWADQRGASSACKHVSLLGRFGEKSCGIDRPVWIHLPSGAKKRPLPVLFMLDGQNIFDRATAAFGQEWQADEAYDALITKKKIRPHIIVALGNSPRRMFEYSPDRDPRRGGDGLESLAKLIADEVIPALKKRTKVDLDASKTGILGSSMGGLAAFHLFLRYPKRFGRIAAVSPSFWWNGNSSAAAVKARKSLAKPARLWLDIGSREGDGRRPILELEKVATALRGKGFAKSDFHTLIENGARHSEPSWRARLPKILQYLYPKSSGS